MSSINRRQLMRIGAGTTAVAGVGATLPLLHPAFGTAADPAPGSADTSHQHQEEHESHSPSSTVGDVDVARMGFDPSMFVTTFDYGDAYTDANGVVIREWQIVA